jgi:phosphomannomutase
VWGAFGSLGGCKFGESWVETGRKMARRTLVLFDVDGTLTEPREAASSEMTSFLSKLKGAVTVGIVGGSDLVKQQEQMGHNIVNEVDFSFSENGLVAFKDGKEIGRQAIHKFLGEANVKRVVNWTLRYIADLDLCDEQGKCYRSAE